MNGANLPHRIRRTHRADPAGTRRGRHAKRLGALAPAALLVALTAPPAAALAPNPDPLNVCGPLEDNAQAPLIDQRNAVACLSNVARCSSQILPMYNVAWLPEVGRPRGRGCASDGSGRFVLVAGMGTYVPPDQTRLGRAAQAKADDIVRCGQFSHTACGRPADFWLRQTGYIPSPSCWGWAENIYWSAPAIASTPRTAVAAWLNSPGHARNMLTSGFYETGVGITRGALQGVSDAKVWVQVFGYRYC